LLLYSSSVRSSLKSVPRPDLEILADLAVLCDYAQDDIESRVLDLLRRMPAQKQLVACKLLEALASP
jgi:hypothetical protein